MLVKVFPCASTSPQIRIDPNDDFFIAGCLTNFRESFQRVRKSLAARDDRVDEHVPSRVVKHLDCIVFDQVIGQKNLTLRSIFYDKSIVFVKKALHQAVKDSIVDGFRIVIDQLEVFNKQILVPENRLVYRVRVDTFDAISSFSASIAQAARKRSIFLRRRFLAQ
ncbi:MAG: hypothetical protein LBE31_00155 [Deltaproteobacteria bacterium]|jgi:hypothetical protein|nr:hypothetical protein [Deltaproteobacteria bacterium]